jgi:hypothetical protein
MAGSQFTFISGYIDLTAYENRPSDKTREKYFEYCKSLIQYDVPFVIFCDTNIIKDVKNLLDSLSKNNNGNHNQLIKLIPFNIKELKHYSDKFLKADLPDTRNTEKDTNYFMMAILQKVYWMKQVSEENPFNSKYFCWIDFGINRVLDTESSNYNQMLKRIDNCDIGDHIILASNGIPYKLELYTDDFVDKFHECFLGGVIAGSKESIRQFSEYQYIIANNLLNLYNKVTWEISIWVYIHITYPKLIKVYDSGFDIRILDNFRNYK